MSYSQALEEQLRQQRQWASSEPTGWTGTYAVLEGFLDSPKQAALFMVQHLLHAESYYVSENIGSTLCGAAASLPDETLAPDVVPCQMGWLWFSTPLAVPGVHARRDLTCQTANVRAISWSRSYRRASGGIQVFGGSSPEPANTPLGVILLAYFDCSGTHPRHLALIDSWVHTNRLSEAPAVPEEHDFTDAALQGGEAIAPFVRRIFYSFSVFVQQRILVTSQQQAERHTRKRLEREGFKLEPVVRVVELRRKQTRSEHHGESEPVEWSHQWIVSGHWRQQWYPSLNANQPIWVMPYVKGPEDKPLKPPRARVFAVVR